MRDMQEHHWLLLSYRLPTELSRVRVAMWRRMRKLGAVYLDEGIWALPNTEALSHHVHEAVTEAERHGGTAVAFVARGTTAEQEKKLLDRFNRARQEEYDEVARECQQLLAHIQREGSGEHFEFSEVEELEADLEKVQRWLTQVQERDVFSIEARHAVQAHLQVCRDALAQFTQQAYERGGEGFTRS